MCADFDESQNNKKFRPQKKGRGAEKKTVAKKKKRGIELEPNRGSNPKAFTRPSDGTYKSKMFLQKTERMEQALRIPTLDLSYAETGKSPPLLVAVVGPPKSGKSTLIRSLVKLYSNKSLKNTIGPITVVSGKTKRFTLFECPTTLHAMCDIAKVADVVLLTVDASFGFEMETFEFLNIALVHGMPRLIGVLTHLDRLKNNKALKKTKKAMRHRFWQEVAQGSKLFYITGLDKTLYKRKEIVNLNHFLLVTKPTEQRWKMSHSHIVADRWEDLTLEANIVQDPQCSRDVAFFGYVRGRPLGANHLVHIPGVGDFPIAHIMWIQDPCAAPGKSEYKKRRHLNAKEKLVYGPLAEIGDMRCDDDAVFVRMDDDAVAHTRIGKGHEMIAALQDALPVKEEVKVDLFDSQYDAATRRSAMHLVEHELTDTKEPSDEEWDDATDSNEEEDAHESVSISAGKKLTSHHRSKELQRHRYKDELDSKHWDECDFPDEKDPSCPFTGVKSEHWAWYRQLAKDEQDRTSDLMGPSTIDWHDDTNLELIRNFFVTGQWESWEGGNTHLTKQMESSKGYESVTDEDGDEDADESQHKDSVSNSSFSSCETVGNEDSVNASGQRKSLKRKKKKTPNVTGNKKAVRTSGITDPEAAELLDSFLNHPMDASDDAAGVNVDLGTSAAIDENAPSGVSAEYWRKKIEKKKQFDQGISEVTNNADISMNTATTKTSYYEQMKDDVRESQEKMEKTLQQLARDTNEKVGLVGFYTGLYVRVVLKNVPVEFTQHFQPTHPLILGGLQPGEETIRIVYARIKRHRWFHRILKANDPVVFSVGWRRFQTQPLYATEDITGRQRYLKYTPRHMHCIAAYYGPTMPPNTGVVAIPSDPFQAHDQFRILATGYTMEVSKMSEIVKKLKLVGTPEKIIKNTVFVKDMFNSPAEAAKYEGAKLQTVSGLRGAIKKALPNREGVFRASFEDKLLMSDIIFMRTFKRVEPQMYYNPVTNYLSAWKGMRTARELRRDLGLQVITNPDSEYIENPVHKKAKERTFSMPTSLMKAVPFSKKVQFDPALRSIGLSKRLREEVDELTDVVTDAHSMKKDLLMKHFHSVEKNVDEKKMEKDQKKQKIIQKKESEEAERKARQLKKFKKEQAKKNALKTPMKRGGKRT